jgi:hypothetical protein
MELVPVERPLPERIAAILQDVREAERHRQEAEADRAREQGRMLQVERHFREEQLRQLEEERSARERLLRQAIDPQVKQAQEIVAQVEASLLKVGQEITASLTSGAAISAATRRSWKRRLEALSALAPGNVSLEQALQDLRQLAREDSAPGHRQVDAAGQSVATALRELERRAALEIQADQIWQLMRSGEAEEALRRVASLRDRLSNNLSEVEALWEMVVEIGAQNQVLDVPAMAEAG